MLCNVLIASWRALRLFGFWSGTSDSCSWGTWSIGGENGRKRFLFSVLMPYFFGGWLGGTLFFFVGKKWYGCMYLCHYVCFFGSKMNKSYSEMVIPSDENKNISLRTRTGIWRHSRTWPFKEAKKNTFLILGDSKLSCVFFSLYVTGFKTTWFWVGEETWKALLYPPC